MHRQPLQEEIITEGKQEEHITQDPVMQEITTDIITTVEFKTGITIREDQNRGLIHRREGHTHRLQKLMHPSAGHTLLLRGPIRRPSARILLRQGLTRHQEATVHLRLVPKAEAAAAVPVVEEEADN